MKQRLLYQKRGKAQLATKKVDNHGVSSIIKNMILSEKSLTKNEILNQYSFIVDLGANKNDIKKAFFVKYNKQPIAINTLLYADKGRANRKLVRRRYKKAIVTLSSGETIDIVS